MKRKVLKITFLSLFAIGILISAKTMYAGSCQVSSGGYNYSCDGNSDESCEFNVDGQDYNCTGKYASKKLPGNSGPA